jgi:hypothetical protein
MLGKKQVIISSRVLNETFITVIHTLTRFIIIIIIKIIICASRCYSALQFHKR